MTRTKPIIKNKRKIERLDLFPTLVSIVKFSDDETDWNSLSVEKDGYSYNLSKGSSKTRAKITKFELLPYEI